MVIGQDYSLDVERKIISILRVLSDSKEPIGSRFIARELRDYGVDLSERAVRYHLKLLDERGLTKPFGRDGRLITAQGHEELKNALVSDKVGFVISKIELLAFNTTFDPIERTGQVAINTSIFRKDRFERAKLAMRNAFRTGLCVSDLVAVAGEGEKLGEATVPADCVGLGTVCSITVNGALLKAGIPLDSKFGGLLQMRNHRPSRFVELISYEGTSLDPSEVFITGKMTSVNQAARTGEGKVLANFRDVPAQARSLVDRVIHNLEATGIRGLLVLGDVGESLCGISVGMSRAGLVLFGGLNPVAAAEEEGVETESVAMNGTVDYSKLVSFWSV